MPRSNLSMLSNMSSFPLHFVLSENVSASKFIKKLSKKLDVQIVAEHDTKKTFYDSFDWRLYNAGIVCEFKQSPKKSQLTLCHKKSGAMLETLDILNIPVFSEDFPAGDFAQQLDKILEMRALLPICDLQFQAHQLNILNKDKKTVLRIYIDEYRLLANHTYLQPLKGYEKAARKVSKLLQESLELKTPNTHVLNMALKREGRKANNYNSKVQIKLKPEMRADEASIIIYQHLLTTIHANEAGTIAAIDTEFLHDFRVAIRRTRSGLSLIKNTLAATEVSQHASFFSWLGKMTGLTRDLDVYLLCYPQYKDAIPHSLRGDISPLYDFLKYKQALAHKELVNKLESPDYRKRLLAWEQYLKQPLPRKGQPSQANISIKELADQRIWKVYQLIMKEGEAIDASTPAEVLHDLRKTCKKLRYLMEFFQSLYSEEDMKEIFKALKGLQAVLGDFQDYETQEIHIKQFSEEMMAKRVPANTLLAMGVLVQHLDTMKCRARDDFAQQFAVFNQVKNQSAFAMLFVHKAKTLKR